MNMNFHKKIHKPAEDTSPAMAEVHTPATVMMPTEKDHSRESSSHHPLTNHSQDRESNSQTHQPATADTVLAKVATTLTAVIVAMAADTAVIATAAVAMAEADTAIATVAVIATVVAAMAADTVAVIVTAAVAMAEVDTVVMIITEVATAIAKSV